MSSVVRVSRALIEEAARHLGLDPGNAKLVVERALIAVIGGESSSSTQLGSDEALQRLRALDEALSQLRSMLPRIIEAVEALNARLEQLVKQSQQVTPAGGQQEQGQQQARRGGSRRRGKRSIAAFCDEQRYQVVDLLRMGNPEAFISAARREGLSVLAPESPEQSTKAVLVCPGVTPDELLEAAKSDQELREALVELGYLYEPEKGVLAWVEEPQLG